MNLIPLAALAVALLAFAAAVTALITVEQFRRRRRVNTRPAEHPNRIPYVDEVGPDFRGQVRSRHAPEPRIMASGTITKGRQ